MDTSDPRQLITASGGVVDGVASFRLSTWQALPLFIDQTLFGGMASLMRHDYVWRGQRSADWPLTSSLDRFLASRPGNGRFSPWPETWANEVLDRFKSAARGRRGVFPPELTDIEWWTLGQHHGLPTPLLDWTRSPFAAAYFAFQEIGDETPSDRALWVLNLRYIRDLGYAPVRDPNSAGNRPPPLEIVDLLSDENSRLISQGGLFTRAPLGMSVDKWVRTTYKGSSTTPILYRLTISGDERRE